jgi:integrase
MTPHTSARNAPEAARCHSVTFQGRKYPLVKEKSGTWRMRSRSRSHPIDAGLGTSDLRAARQIALDLLSGTTAHQPRKPSSKSLEDVAQVYLSMPKRCGQKAAKLNVGQLRAVCRTVYAKELAKLTLEDVGPKLWRDFQAAKQGGKLDLSTRRRENIAINSAVSMARSLFIAKLRPEYAEHGIQLPADASLAVNLPTPSLLPSPADDAGFCQWFEDCSTPHDALWLAAGLARFAGLRRSEIAALTPAWIVQSNQTFYVQMGDRAEYLTKTGQVYRAPILRASLAQHLLALPFDRPAVQPETADRRTWIERTLPGILKRWTGKARKPTHRLRGLYADDVARIYAGAREAALAGIQAASQALGHTSTETTTQHYLTPDALR